MTQDKKVAESFIETSAQAIEGPPSIKHAVLAATFSVLECLTRLVSYQLAVDFRRLKNISISQSESAAVVSRSIAKKRFMEAIEAENKANHPEIQERISLGETKIREAEAEKLTAEAKAISADSASYQEFLAAKEQLRIAIEVLIENGGGIKTKPEDKQSE